MKKVLILSANKYGAYSSSVLNICLKNEIYVSMVVVKKMNNLNRLKNEFKRDKFGLFSKFLKKFILQRLITIGFKYFYIDGFSQYFIDNYKADENLINISRKNNIPLIEVDDFHSNSTIKLIRDLGLDIILFTGGGIIKESLIEIPKIGILNCHMGILPSYRGMDCNYWAILNKDFKKLGYTTHLIDKGVDTGSIVKRYHLHILENEKISKFINRIEYLMAESLVESLIMLFEDKVVLEKQEIKSGKQFYVMVNEIKNKIKSLKNE